MNQFLLSVIKYDHVPVGEGFSSFSLWIKAKQTGLWLQFARYWLSTDSRLRVKYFSLYKVRITYNIRGCRDFKIQVSMGRISCWWILIKCQSGYIFPKPWKPRAIVLFTLKNKNIFSMYLCKTTFWDCVWTCIYVCIHKYVSWCVLLYWYVHVNISYILGWESRNLTRYEICGLPMLKGGL